MTLAATEGSGQDIPCVYALLPSKCYALCFVLADLAHGVREEVIVPAVDEGHNTEPEWGEYYEEIEAFGLYLTNTYGVSIMPLWRTSRRQTNPWRASTEPGIVL